MKNCEVCQAPTTRGRARCNEHPRYRRADPGACDLCGNKAYRMRLCWGHFKTLSGGHTCALGECSQPVYSKRVPFCVTHYNRVRTTGTVKPLERFKLVDGTCQQCGVVLNTKNDKTTLFCSTRCRKRNARGRQEIDRACFMCDTIIPKEASLRKKFCSKECADRARARDSRVSDGTVTRKQIEQLILFYGNKCINPFCKGAGVGKYGRISKDHIIAISNGGKHSIYNMQPLCLKCNIEKGTHTIDYRHDLGVKFAELLKEKQLV